jgi:hypothetical protein
MSGRVLLTTRRKAPAMSQAERFARFVFTLGMGGFVALRAGFAALRVGFVTFCAGFAAVVCAFGVVLVFAVAPALATAALEAPKVTAVYGVSATTATFEGVLQPLAVEASEAGSYKYVYDEGSSCTGVGMVETTSGVALGNPGEALPAEAVSGLVSGMQYAVCLSVTNPSGTVLSAPVMFTTGPPEKPVTEAVSGQTTTTAVLHGLLNPGAPGRPGAYEFVYRQSPDECEGPGERTAAGGGLGGMGEMVSAEIGELWPGSEYTVCLLAYNEVGETTLGNAVTFMTVAIPLTVTGEESSEVTSSQATVSATIDPGGMSTTYRVQYGTSSIEEHSTTATNLGTSTTPVGVRQTLSGLEAGTEYHYRFVASNAGSPGGVEGEQAVFTTMQSFAALAQAGLPDERSYELLTPSVQGDLLVYDPDEYGVASVTRSFYSTNRLVRAAADGNGLAYEATPPVEGGAGRYGENAGNQYLARRSATGWTSTSLQPALEHTDAEYARYQYFSSDLSVGILANSSMAGEPEFEGYTDLYERNTSTSGYEPLSTVHPPHRTPTNFGAASGEGSRPYPQQLLLYAGSSVDMSHNLFEADDSLTPLAEEDPPTIAQNDLYDSVSGKLYLVNVLPDGKVAPGATFGGAGPKIESGSAKEALNPDLRNVISADGSRVFWTDLSDDDLYVRENDTSSIEDCAVAGDACTVLIAEDARFWSATPDGSRVLFTDCNRLTPDSTAVPSQNCGEENIDGHDEHDNSVNQEELLLKGSDLYEYDVGTGGLTDLTVDPHPSTDLSCPTIEYPGGVTVPPVLCGANVQGVLGTSEDGDYVYFVAGGVLANGAVAGQENLYVSHAGEALKYISNADRGVSGSEEYGDWRPSAGELTAQVSADGRHVVYMSGGQLFMYDFGAVGPKCLSCAPDRGGAIYPVSYAGEYGLRVLSGNANRVFFDSGGALVPQDTNGHVDVYEWEREGTDAEGDIVGGGESSCPVEVPARASGGCVFLLSGGTFDEDSYFLDASESGDDVFIVTEGQLGSEPVGEAAHIYDVRVGQSPTPSECSGSGCQGVPLAPPIFATPSSVTFAGVGDFEPSPPPPGGQESHSKRVARKTVKCARGKHRGVNGKCVKNKKKAGKAGRGGRKADSAAGRVGIERGVER